MKIGEPSSANKHRFSKFPKTRKAPSTKMPRGLGTTGFVVNSIVSRLVKKTSKKCNFFDVK
ncbi:hypothetical protein AMR71_03650 [Bacillus altitudinis]|nr:hypothetical protein AKO65_07335 [Bacillus altitudinis]ALM44375.1 hypothetical protein AMR71_03650 [Bacillus altitudinis]ANY95850.1 hypothetical protein AKO66_03650 [Bacillus altitudinis]